MKNGFIYLFMTLMCGTVFASTPKVEFNGMFSGLGQTVESDSNAVNINVKYIPLLKFDISPQIDAELSGNIFTFFDSDDMSDTADSLEIKPYRAWIRYSTTRFEARMGLQKINFGSARILRSLMWFDQLDPKDPLQFTDGIYGLRLRYDFQNNANIRLWGLYGNDNPKGWEIFGTKEHIPEAGGRIQYPIGNAELAVSAHHRSVQQEGIVENRIALDGFWDVGIGLWFESALVHADFEDGNEKDYQSFLTLGTDYTFAIGNGITATAEHLLMSIGSRPFDGNDRYNISALSLSYLFGVMDRLSLFSYYNWDLKIPFSFLSWRRTYDHWIIQFSGYWTSEANTAPMASGRERTMENRGLQFMTIFNY